MEEAFEIDSSSDQDISLSREASVHSEVSASGSDIDLGNSSDAPVVSLLESLKSPEPSELSHKRRVISNKPPVGLKRGKGITASSPKSVSLMDRVKSYPGK